MLVSSSFYSCTFHSFYYGDLLLVHCRSWFSISFRLWLCWCRMVFCFLFEIHLVRSLDCCICQMVDVSWFFSCTFHSLYYGDLLFAHCWSWFSISFWRWLCWCRMVFCFPFVIHLVRSLGCCYLSYYVSCNGWTRFVRF